MTALTYLDTGLTEDVEYFYTIKAVSSSGISQPSDENSAVPYAGAVPWGGSVYDVTDAIQARVSVYADYIRVCGPDGTIYDSTQPTPQSPDGYLIEGTTLFVHSSGQVFPLPRDGAVVSSSGEEGGYGMLSAGWTPVELNGHSYGPYRRVSSRQESGHYYFGAGGNFVLPDRNGISLRGNKTTPYIYLGSHAQDMTYGPSWVEVDAGLMWNRNFFRNAWDAYLFTNTAGKKSFGRARVNMGLGSSFRFMAGMSVYMAYWTSFDTSILVIQGLDEYFNYKTVIVANAYGAMWYPAAIIKRAHSYATGSPDEYRNGSYVWGAEVSDMALYHFATGGGTEAVWWTKDRTPTPPSGHQWPWPWVSGCYPAPSVGEVTWRETDAYVSEDRINIGP